MTMTPPQRAAALVDIEAQLNTQRERDRRIRVSRLAAKLLTAAYGQRGGVDDATSHRIMLAQAFAMAEAFEVERARRWDERIGHRL